MIEHEQTNHELGFRPSWFPAGTQCVHFESDETRNIKAKKRGTGIHDKIVTQLLLLVVEFPGELTGDPQIDYAIGIVNEYLFDGWTIFAIEQEIEILGEDGETITTGTIDLVLENSDREFVVIDWKTGEIRDHATQINSYGVAWNDLHPEAKSVRTLAVYLDAKETRGGLLNYTQASEHVLNLYQQWRTKNEQPYRINPYCDWCNLRGDCPAWRASADQALDTVQKLSAPSSVALQTAKIDLLKNDAVALDSFLIAYERLKLLVEDDWNLKEALKTHLQTNGFKSPNFSLVTIQSKDETVKKVNPEQFILTAAKYAGAARMAPALSIDVEKALAAWKAFTNDPFPCEIKEYVTEHPGYSYIRRKGGNHGQKKK